MTSGDLRLFSTTTLPKMSATPAKERTPAEIWGMIVSSVLFFPLQQLMFQRWETTTLSGPHKPTSFKEYRNYLQQRSTLRLVCRSWRDFADGPCQDDRLVNLLDTTWKYKPNASMWCPQWLFCTHHLPLRCLRYPSHPFSSTLCTQIHMECSSLVDARYNYSCMVKNLKKCMENSSSVTAITLCSAAISFAKKVQMLYPQLTYLDLDISLSPLSMLALANRCPRLEVFKSWGVDAAENEEAVVIPFKHLTHLTLSYWSSAKFLLETPALTNLYLLGSHHNEILPCNSFVSPSLQKVHHLAIGYIELPPTFWEDFPSLQTLDIYSTIMAPYSGSEIPSTHPFHVLGWHSEKPSTPQMNNIAKWLLQFPHICRLEMSFPLINENELLMKHLLDLLEDRDGICFVDGDGLSWSEEMLLDLLKDRDGICFPDEDGVSWNEEMLLGLEIVSEGNRE